MAPRPPAAWMANHLRSRRPGRFPAWLAGSVLFACTKAPPSTTPTAEPSASSALPPQSAVPGVFALACEAECSDENAKLTVYRNDAGAIGVVTVQGSPAGCSHPPLRFFGPDGAERAAIPFVPVAPGSPEAERYRGIWVTQTASLREAETMFCREVKH